MSNEQNNSLSPIGFTFEYSGHGWAHATVSDGVTTYEMDPSYVPQDPLFSLVAALARVLAYGGETTCTWQYEPAEDRWSLRRDGEALHIAITGVNDGFTRPSWPTVAGALYFSTTCDLWRFAAKVRTAVSRLESAGQEYHDPTRVLATPEYRALCAYLDEHKRAQRSPSAKSRRR